MYEDLLSSLTLGEMVSVKRNGTNGVTKAAITELQPLGVFATWQAERLLGIMTATHSTCALTRRES
jgi:HlyD family secretion protein